MSNNKPKMYEFKDKFIRLNSIDAVRFNGRTELWIYLSCGESFKQTYPSTEEATKAFQELLTLTNDEQ